MTDADIPVEPARERDWKQTIRQPKVWIPTAAVAIVAIAVGGAAVAAGGGGTPAAAPSSSASASPTLAADGLGPTGTATPTTTASASPSPSASPSYDFSGGGEDFEAEAPVCVPNGTVVAAPKQSTAVVLPATAAGDPVTAKGGSWDSFASEGFSADGSRVLTHTYNEGSETITVRKAASLKEVESFPSQLAAEAAWDRSHTKLAVATTDADNTLTLRVVDPSSGAATVIFTQTFTIAQDVAWSPDGRCLLLTSRWSDNLWDEFTPDIHEVRIVDASTGASSYLSDGLSAVYSPSGDSIFFYGVDEDQGVKLFQADSATGVIVVRSIGKGATLDQVGRPAIAFSPDGKVGVYTEWPHQYEANIKNIESSGEGDGYLAKYPETGVWNLAWAPDSKRVAYVTGQYEGTGKATVVVADAFSGKVLSSSEAPGNWVSGGIAWLPDGSGLVVGTRSGSSTDISGTLYRYADGEWTVLRDAQAGHLGGTPAWSYDGSTMVWAQGSTIYAVHK